MNAAAGAAALKEGELIYLTDEKVFAGATSAGEYAGLVEFATQEEAEAGTVENKAMNPLRVKQAVAALGGGKVRTSISGSVPLLASDANGTVIQSGFSSAGTITTFQIPSDANATIAQGSIIRVISARPTLASRVEADPGVTLNFMDAPFISPLGSADLVKTGANQWSIINYSELDGRPTILGYFASATASDLNLAFGSIGVPNTAAGVLHVLFCETAAQAVSTPAGYTVIPGLPQTTGTAGSTSATALYGFYRVLDGSETSVSIPAPGDHLVYQSLFITGADPVTPFAAGAGNVAGTAATAVSMPTVTTVRNDNLVIAAVAYATDTNVAQFSGPVNTNLSSLIVKNDRAPNTGNGGGIALVTGIKAAPGATGTTTGTLATSSVQARWTGAINPK